jgi:hypothetical protein
MLSSSSIYQFSRSPAPGLGAMATAQPVPQYTPVRNDPRPCHERNQQGRDKQL